MCILPASRLHTRLKFKTTLSQSALDYSPHTHAHFFRSSTVCATGAAVLGITTDTRATEFNRKVRETESNRFQRSPLSVTTN